MNRIWKKPDFRNPLAGMDLRSTTATALSLDDHIVLTIEIRLVNSGQW